MNEHPDDHDALTPETLAAYFEAGHPAEQRLSEEPLCVLGIDPPRGELTLRTPATGSDIDVSAYRMIRTDIVEEPGDETVWFRVTVEARGIEYEAYSLLQSVTDQLQQGDDLERALHVALDAFRGLLARAPRLSEDQEIGLFGELVALDRLIDGVGETEALAAWLGPRAEEHDFVLGEADVEVKTTRSERRIHVIHGLGQLTPTPGRPLHLMSVQVTGAGAAGNGQTLPELIERIRRRLRSGRTDFDDRLTDCGSTRRVSWSAVNRASTPLMGPSRRSPPPGSPGSSLAPSWSAASTTGSTSPTSNPRGPHPPSSPPHPRTRTET